MEEEYSRRYQKRPYHPSKALVTIVILLLLINTISLSFLLFLNVQLNAKQETQLDTIEKQIRSLDQRSTQSFSVGDHTEKNVPNNKNYSQGNQPITDSSIAASTEQSESSTVASSPDKIQQEERSQEANAPSTTTTYTVQAGDTLSVIAEKNKLSLQELMAKNNLTDSTVYIGQVLSVQ